MCSRLENNPWPVIVLMQDKCTLNCPATLKVVCGSTSQEKKRTRTDKKTTCNISRMTACSEGWTCTEGKYMLFPLYWGRGTDPHTPSRVELCLKNPCYGFLFLLSTSLPRVNGNCPHSNQLVVEYQMFVWTTIAAHNCKVDVISFITVMLLNFRFIISKKNATF